MNPVTIAVWSQRFIGTTYLAQADNVDTKEAFTTAVWTIGGSAGGKGYFYGDGDWINAKDYANDGHGTEVWLQKMYRGEWVAVGTACVTSSGKNCTRDVPEGTMVRLKVSSDDGAGKGNYSKPVRA